MGGGFPFGQPSSEGNVGSTMPRAILLIEERLLIDRPYLYVVNPLDIGNVGSEAGVGQLAILSHGFSLQIRRP